MGERVDAHDTQARYAEGKQGILSLDCQGRRRHAARCSLHRWIDARWTWAPHSEVCLGLVVMTDDLEANASAKGVCSPWIHDIRGAEVLALLQAATLAFLGLTHYFLDCQSVVHFIKSGRENAVRADTIHARVYNLLLAVLDDIRGEDFTLVPAH